VQCQQLPTESDVFEDEVRPATERTDQPAEEMPERHDHGKNFSGKDRIKLYAKSLISQVYDLLARHSRDVLVGEDTPAFRTVKQPAKNTDSAFFIQVAAAASLPSQLVYHSSDYSAFMPTLVTVRFGPSNGGQTTVWISLPCLTTTMRRFTNPPVLGRRELFRCNWH
jgi:hypothetical protein